MELGVVVGLMIVLAGALRGRTDNNRTVDAKEIVTSNKLAKIVRNT